MATPKTAGRGARSPMRARFRTQVREDIKAAALAQLAEGGPAAVSVNAIAKGLGVSGPALYRYFAGRDDLLAELVRDAYHDLAEALNAASGRDLGLSPPERLRALTAAWRAFARAAPHRYRLLFAPPVPGYDAHAEPLVAASRHVMAVALDVFAALSTGKDGPGPSSGAVDLLAASQSSEQMFAATGADPDDLALTVSAWTRLHGFVSLELGGNFTAMGIDTDALFHREVEDLVHDHSR